MPWKIEKKKKKLSSLPSRHELSGYGGEKIAVITAYEKIYIKFAWHTNQIQLFKGFIFLQKKYLK